MGTKNKKVSLRLHAQKRMVQHHGLDLSRWVRKEIQRQIQSGTSRFIRKTSNNRTVHDVQIGERLVRVVWDKQRSMVITVLPRSQDA